MKKYPRYAVDFISTASWFDYEESFNGVEKTVNVLFEFKILDEVSYTMPKSFMPNSDDIEPMNWIGVTKE